MAIGLDHTIVSCRDNLASALFLANLLGRGDPVHAFGTFQVVELDNHVSLDFMTVTANVPAQHYAFLVSEDEFTAIFGRIQEQGLDYWADPRRTKAGRINRNDGGRGVYWQDPDGHLLEIITRPYGSG